MFKDKKSGDMIPARWKFVPVDGIKYLTKEELEKKGDCWDNAVAESFFHSLKTELIHHEKLDIFINSFYLIKKDHKLFDKYEIFKTNISLLLTFSKKSKNQILHSTNPFIKGF